MLPVGQRETGPHIHFRQGKRRGTSPREHVEGGGGANRDTMKRSRRARGLQWKGAATGVIGGVAKGEGSIKNLNKRMLTANTRHTAQGNHRKLTEGRKGQMSKT